MFINKEGFSDLIAELALNNNHSLTHSFIRFLCIYLSKIVCSNVRSCYDKCTVGGRID